MKKSLFLAGILYCGAFYALSEAQKTEQEDRSRENAILVTVGSLIGGALYASGSNNSMENTAIIFGTSCLGAGILYVNSPVKKSFLGTYVAAIFCSTVAICSEMNPSMPGLLSSTQDHSKAFCGALIGILGATIGIYVTERIMPKKENN